MQSKSLRNRKTHSTIWQTAIWPRPKACSIFDFEKYCKESRRQFMLMKLIYLDWRLSFFIFSLKGKKFSFCKHFSLPLNESGTESGIQKNCATVRLCKEAKRLKLGHKTSDAMSRKDRLYSAPAGVSRLNLDTIRSAPHVIISRGPSKLKSRFSIFGHRWRGDVCQPVKVEYTRNQIVNVNPERVAFVISIKANKHDKVLLMI